MAQRGTRPDAHETLRVALIQMEHLRSVPQNLSEAKRMLEMASDEGARLALLPEYFYARLTGEAETAARSVRAFLKRQSSELEMAIGANVVESTPRGLQNIGVIYHEGEALLEQAKVHPMPKEVEHGIKGGDRFETTRVEGQVVGMLVCSDILYPEAAGILALHGATLILNPVMSPSRPDDQGIGAREAVYVARAYDSGAFVLKAGGHRKKDPAIAGRSLVAAPWGIISHYTDESASEVLLADLDLERLVAHRKHQRGFPARRPEVYRALTESDMKWSETE